jgi:hypothetical protein
MAVTIRGRGPTAKESNVGSVARRRYCKYDGCTAEAMLTDEDIFLCMRHMALALDTFQSGYLRLTQKSPAEIQERRENWKREVDAAIEVGKVKGAVVYYVMLHGLVKIGTTINLRSRMQSYQVAFDSDALLGYEPGGYDLEQLRHSQFMALHVRGELFTPGKALMQHISEINARRERVA